MAMVAICMSISFMACESDDHKTENINLKGRWYSKTETVNNLLIINDDNSVVTYKVSDYESWESINGNLTVEKSVRKMNKDRWSALAYVIFYIMEYQNTIEYNEVSDMDILTNFTCV